MPKIKKGIARIRKEKNNLRRIEYKFNKPNKNKVA